MAKAVISMTMSFGVRIFMLGMREIHFNQHIARRAEQNQKGQNQEFAPVGAYGNRVHWSAPPFRLGMVEQQLSDAITAMHNQDSDLAKRVIEGDKNVNMMEVAIDEACVRIIAKRQPTASDLRLVMVISKTIAELERIGDVADKICRTALEKFSQQHQPLLVSLESLGRHTIQMLHDVLDAFARMDIDEAVRIYREDKKVDQEYEGIVRQLMTYMMEDSRTIPSVLTALFCARSIERIGDRCQNICEFIFYYVKGQDFRHVGGDELDKLLAGKDSDK